MYREYLSNNVFTYIATKALYAKKNTCRAQFLSTEYHWSRTNVEALLSLSPTCQIISFEVAQKQIGKCRFIKFHDLSMYCCKFLMICV